MKKRCFKCGKKKRLREFYKHKGMADGRLNKCKECTKEDSRKNLAKRRVYYSICYQLRNKRPEIRKKRMEYQRARRKREPEKYKAVMAVSNAIRDGRLKKGKCEVCGSPKVQAHHKDYSKPLDVQWFCFRHHREKEHGQTVVSPEYWEEE